MKIAIQGHPTRGKEVIQILESLGGKNTEKLEGTYKTFYYIDNKGEIGDDHRDNFPPIYKLYTLDEFESEFPFKVGDIVALNGINKPHEIIALEFYVNKLCYKLDNGFHFSPRALIIYGEMKEERNITLTLDKAKEWYKKGGELKEIALQAFSEKELNPLPRSWEEFCEKYSKIDDKEYFIDSNSSILQVKAVVSNPCRLQNSDRNICPSVKSAEAHLAMIQLEQLRNCWRQGWKPTTHEAVYAIKFSVHGLGVYNFVSREFLSFPTKEMAEEFLECFRDLIEKAEDLI